MRLAGGVHAFDREEHRAGLILRQRVQPIHKLTCQAQLLSIGPRGGELLDAGPVLPRGQFPHDKLRNGRGSLAGGQPLEGFLDAFIAVDLGDVAHLEFFTLGGEVDSGLAVGVRLGEADQPGGQVAGLSGFELGEGQAGGRD